MAWHYLATDEYGSVSGWGTNRYDQYVITQNQIDNAKEIYDNLYYRGWKHNPICAVIGNLMWESLINPGQYEYGTFYQPAYGLGLAMWTPRSKWLTYANQHSYSIYDGASQIEYMLSDMWGSGWNTSRGLTEYPEYPYTITPTEFYADESLSVTYLANAFGCNYEGGTYSPLRAGNANYWDTYFQGYTPTPPTPPQPILNYPVWLLFKLKGLI